MTDLIQTKDKSYTSGEENLKYGLLLTVGTILAVIPGVLLAPFSIHFFDEPYQILNAYDWTNSVYSPLSAFLGNIFGNLFSWKYLSFRYLMIILTSLSVYMTSLYAVVHSQRKALLCIIGIFACYFSTVFKSDINIYGWDNWSALFTTAVILLMVDLLHKFNYTKIIFIGILSGITVLLRLPNLCIVFFCMVLMIFYYARSKPPRKILAIESLYIFTAALTILILTVCLYGSISGYLHVFKENPIGAHSINRIIKPLIVSVLSIIRFAIIMLMGYFAIFLGVKKTKKQWLKVIISIGVSLCLLILLFPLRRQVLGNVVEMAISIAIISIILLFIKAYRHKNYNMFLFSLTIFILGCVVLTGSNWGFFKFIAWPVIPLLLMKVSGYWTKSIKYYCLSIGAAYFIFSFICISRPTFFDGNLNELNYRFSQGVLEGMYTTQQRGKFIDEVCKETSTYKENGYEIFPLRNWNDYLWEYIYTHRNPYQRHNFDTNDSFNQKEYVMSVQNRIETANTPILFLYMHQDSIPSRMYDMLSKKTIKVKDGEEYSIFKTR